MAEETGKKFCPSHPNAYCPQEEGEKGVGRCGLCGHDFSVNHLDREAAKASWQASRLKGEAARAQCEEAERQAESQARMARDEQRWQTVAAGRTKEEKLGALTGFAGVWETDEYRDQAAAELATLNRPPPVQAVPPPPPPHAPCIPQVVSENGGLPYPFKGKEYQTLMDLVGDFSKKDNWSNGSAEVRRGHLTDWLRKNSKYDAASFVEELRDDKTLGDDLNLFLIIAHFCPNLPLVWKGQALDEKSLLALAVRQDQSALVVLSDVFERHLMIHPRLDNRADSHQLGQAWLQAVRENETLWAMKPLRAVAATHRGERRIEVANAFLAIVDTNARRKLLEQVQELAKNSMARKCDWFVSQVAQASSQSGILHALACLGDQAVMEGESVIREEARQAKAAEDARLWGQRRRRLVALASVFGLGLGSIMGMIRYWMTSLDPFYWTPWDYSKGFGRELVQQPLGLSLSYLAIVVVGTILAILISLYYERIVE